jgi:hypothetical protein
MYIQHSATQSSLSDLFRKRSRASKLEEILGHFGVSLISLIPEDLMNDDSAIDKEDEAEIQEAALSGAMSYRRDDRLRQDPLKDASYRRNLTLGLRLYAWTLRYLRAHPEIETVIIPNGRLADQRCLMVAAKSAGREVLYYEIGRAKPNSVYFGNHRVHNRVGTQQVAFEHSLTLPEDQVISVAKGWLEARTSRDSETNPFSQTWKRAARKNPLSDSLSTRSAVFFTSSADEFSALGPSWNLQEWAHQYEAFDAIATTLEAAGVSCTVRIHPNLSNKANRHFRDEIVKIFALQRNHPKMTIIWPNQPVDSYSLLSSADYVVVARSTIGLEASLLGKCVWTTTPTRYDQMADVKRIWRKEEVNLDAFEHWVVDSLGAARFVAHTVLYDIPFSNQCSEEMNNLKKRQWLGGRLVSFLAPQPLPHKFHLLSLEISTQVQKRIPPWFFHGWFAWDGRRSFARNSR